MSIGTKEGTEEEIRFVKLLNSDKNHKFWDKMGYSPNRSNLFAIHVRKEKYGKINERMVKTKADDIICSGEVDSEYLKSNGFYLDEEDISRFGLTPVKKSGISVKRKDSYKYQILKMNPSTFGKVFGDTELGAGASIYCIRESELKKNTSVLHGWKTDWKKFEEFFSFITGVGQLKDKEAPIEKRLKIAKKIKKWSNEKIHKAITGNKNISDFVFRGIGNFNEPYIATWFYEKGDIKKARPIGFVVTTGSGRSHGDFTVVIKPKS